MGGQQKRGESTTRHGREVEECERLGGSRGSRGETGNLCDTADERGTFFIMFCPVQRA